MKGRGSLPLLKRFPPREQIVPVYAVIVFILYSWTTLQFLWKLPGWLYFLSIGEIFATFSYSMATNFFESALILSIPVAISLVLPYHWFRDVFVARGVTMSVLGMGYLYYLAIQFQGREDYPGDVIRLIPFVAITFMIISFAVGRVTFLSKILQGFAERATVLLYFSIPISLLSLFLILCRNIF